MRGHLAGEPPPRRQNSFVRPEPKGRQRKGNNTKTEEDEKVINKLKTIKIAAFVSIVDYSKKKKINCFPSVLFLFWDGRG